MRITKLRTKILKQRGLITEVTVKRPRRLAEARKSLVPDNLKSPQMRLVELQQGKAIEDILLAGSLRQVATKIDVDFSTVSKWIKTLGLRYDANHLPDCNQCHRLNMTCQATHLCTVLQESRAPIDVLLAKREQMEST